MKGPSYTGSTWPTYPAADTKADACVRACVRTKSLQSCPTLETAWTVVHQAPLSTVLFRQEYWSGLPCPPPGDLPNPGIEPASSALQADSLPLSHRGSPQGRYQCLNFRMPTTCDCFSHPGQSFKFIIISTL